MTTGSAGAVTPRWASGSARDAGTCCQRSVSTGGSGRGVSGAARSRTGHTGGGVRLRVPGGFVRGDPGRVGRPEGKLGGLRGLTPTRGVCQVVGATDRRDGLKLRPEGPEERRGLVGVLEMDGESVTTGPEHRGALASNLPGRVLDMGPGASDDLVTPVVAVAFIQVPGIVKPQVDIDSGLAGGKEVSIFGQVPESGQGIFGQPAPGPGVDPLSVLGLHEVPELGLPGLDAGLDVLEFLAAQRHPIQGCPVPDDFQGLGVRESIPVVLESADLLRVLESPGQGVSDVLGNRSRGLLGQQVRMLALSDVIQVYDLGPLPPG